MVARKGMSKRLRFEVLKRDGFRCVYCGASPIRGYLHIDHVIPLVEGGSDHPDNLVTACRDCNLGKGPVPLDESKIDGESADPKSRDPEAILERAEHIRAYIDAQKALEDAREYEVDQAEDLWQRIYPDALDWDSRDRIFMRQVMERFDWEDVTWALRRAGNQCRSDYQGWKYFCAIAHRWLKSGVTR